MLKFAILSTILSTVLSQSVKYYDWEAAKLKLEELKDAWLNNGVIDYTYSYRGSCFCLYCFIAQKYVVIENKDSTEDGYPLYVEFDESVNNQFQTCDVDDIYTPLADNYNNITAFYDMAIAHAQRGIDAMCDVSTTTTSSFGGGGFFGSAICGGYIEIDYDSDLSFPTLLSLQYGPFIADAGIAYYFDCLTVDSSEKDATQSSDTCTPDFERPEVCGTIQGLTCEDGYECEDDPFDDCVLGKDSDCSGFCFPVDAIMTTTAPVEGDECGEAGVDCGRMLCPVGLCLDGNDGTYGCTGTCYWIENSDGDLVCIGYLPQDVGCDYEVCETKQGLTCPSGFNCKDDPFDNCELGVDADCAGICVECTRGKDCDDDTTTTTTTKEPKSTATKKPTTTTTTTTTTTKTPKTTKTPVEGEDCGEPGVDCPLLRCAVFDCQDGNGNSWGCNGECTWVADSMTGELECSGSVPQRLCDYDICGTILGLTCKDGFECVDDTTDDCELGVDSDCAGWCREEDPTTTTRTPTPSCGGFDYCVTYRPDKCNYCECGVTDSGKEYEKCTSTYSNSYYCNYNSNYFDGECTSCEDGYLVNDEGECEACFCTDDYKPVCCDGVTYSNECNAGCNSQSCTGDIAEGPCQNKTTTATPAPSCGGIDYCSSYSDGCNTCSCSSSFGFEFCTLIACPDNNKTDSNTCISCEDGYALSDDGSSCEACVCTLEYEPVCCNGVTYSNECAAKCASDCRGDVEDGACKTTTKTPDDICELDAETGPCRAYFPSYFYNRKTCECDKFIYGGCFGNDNRFDTLDECEEAAEECECDTTTDIPTTTADICGLGAETGPCRAAIDRYFYNSETCECELFTYGGCYGNANNFETKKECEEVAEDCDCDICCDPDDPVLTDGTCREGCACCPDGEWVGSWGDGKTYSCGNKTLVVGEDDDLFGDVCEPVCCDPDDPVLSVIGGTCREGCACCPDGEWVGSIGDAKTFTCGNKTLVKGEDDDLFGDVCNFTTTEMPTTTADICELDIVPGPCKASYTRYAYNSETCECEEFVYGGCGGNSNNFESKKECEEVADECDCDTSMPTTTADICGLEAETGLCKAAFERYFYNPKTCECETFTWGGCGGNANKFESEKECEEAAEECPCTTTTETVDITSTCTCYEIYDPVCCDGVTYSNDCFAKCECDGDIEDDECKTTETPQSCGGIANCEAYFDGCNGCKCDFDSGLESCTKVDCSGRNTTTTFAIECTSCIDGYEVSDDGYECEVVVIISDANKYGVFMSFVVFIFAMFN